MHLEGAVQLLRGRHHHLIGDIEMGLGARLVPVGRDGQDRGGEEHVERLAEPRDDGLLPALELLVEPRGGGRVLHRPAKVQRQLVAPAASRLREILLEQARGLRRRGPRPQLRDPPLLLLPARLGHLGGQLAVRLRGQIEREIRAFEGLAGGLSLLLPGLDVGLLLAAGQLRADLVLVERVPSGQIEPVSLHGAGGGDGLVGAVVARGVARSPDQAARERSGRERGHQRPAASGLDGRPLTRLAQRKEGVEVDGQRQIEPIGERLHLLLGAFEIRVGALALRLARHGERMGRAMDKAQHQRDLPVRGVLEGRAPQPPERGERQPVAVDLHDVERQEKGAPGREPVVASREGKAGLREREGGERAVEEQPARSLGVPGQLAEAPHARGGERGDHGREGGHLLGVRPPRVGPAQQGGWLAGPVERRGQPARHRGRQVRRPQPPGRARVRAFLQAKGHSFRRQLAVHDPERIWPRETRQRSRPPRPPRSPSGGAGWRPRCPVTVRLGVPPRCPAAVSCQGPRTCRGPRGPAIPRSPRDSAVTP
jgi:hypothetical protein